MRGRGKTRREGPKRRKEEARETRGGRERDEPRLKGRGRATDRWHAAGQRRGSGGKGALPPSSFLICRGNWAEEKASSLSGRLSLANLPLFIGADRTAGIPAFATLSRVGVVCDPRRGLGGDGKGRRRISSLTLCIPLSTCIPYYVFFLFFYSYFLFLSLLRP